jgi:predicted RNase H-like HicB family nuclease
MTLLVELEQEEDGRWIAEVVDLPGVLAYGQTPEEANAKVQALALRVVADRLEHGEAGPVLVFPLRPHEPMAQYPCETRLIRAAPNRLDH